MAEENEIYTADDRLIVALDVDSFDKMKALVDELGDLISYYKVGMELYYSAGSDMIESFGKENTLCSLGISCKP